MSKNKRSDSTKYRHSIRRQFTAAFVTVVVLTVTLCIVANSILLEKIYMRNKEKALRNAYSEIYTAAYAGDLKEENFTASLQRFAIKNNVSIMIITSLYEPVTVYSNESIEDLLIDIRGSIRGTDPFKEIIEQSDDYIIALKDVSQTKTEYIEMIGNLEGVCMFLMRTPVESIKESTALANRVLIYVGLISLLLSFVFIFFFSRRITKPVLELADLSKRMTGLDFDARYEGNTDSEIGLLGNNMNVLSDTIKDNISRLKSANIELKNDNEKREQIDEMRKEFISNVSHEFKTPIALIMGYAEGLKEGIDDKNDRDYYCDVIADEAENLNRMVKKLLDLNRIEFGRETVSMDRFDVVSFLQNAVSPYNVIAEKNDIKLGVSTGAPLYVWADEVLTKEALDNYLTNALDHAESEGQKRIDVYLEMQENKVKVCVYNTGKHIPEDSLERIWDKFYKVDKARTRKYGGSGVGLSIVKAVTDAMGQECGVSNVENGVVFWFTLETAKPVSEEK